ncbi:MAG: hypothetical protein ACUVT9_05445 [Candidatus Bathycorpusculaceae bacterium]
MGCSGFLEVLRKKAELEELEREKKRLEVEQECLEFVRQVKEATKRLEECGGGDAACRGKRKKTEPTESEKATFGYGSGNANSKTTPKP